MDDLSPTQRISRDLAEALLATPEFREKFERMARETADREPVPDDFAWLETSAVVTPLRREKDYSQTAFDVVRRATERHG